MIALGALQLFVKLVSAALEDVSLMGFDEILTSRRRPNPILSSVSQSGYQLGTTAARILLGSPRGRQKPSRSTLCSNLLRLRPSVAALTRRRGDTDSFALNVRRTKTTGRRLCSDFDSSDGDSDILPFSILSHTGKLVHGWSRFQQNRRPRPGPSAPGMQVANVHIPFSL